MDTITTLFFDIGGVCLSNGWDHEQRRAVAKQFGIEHESFDSRHQQIVDSLERGFMTLHEYLDWAVFYEPRAFSHEELEQAIKRLSTPIDGTLELVRAVGRSRRYLQMTINNESRELNEYRIERFGLGELFTGFFTSCYLGLLKPQPEHYRRALQIAQRPAGQCLYIDDRPLNVEVARILGMQTIHFESAAQLERDLRDAGVQL